jgi:hypothetical protein
VRQELYTLDFALSGKAALDILDGHVGEQILTAYSTLRPSRSIPYHQRS